MERETGPASVIAIRRRWLQPIYFHHRLSASCSLSRRESSKSLARRETGPSPAVCMPIGARSRASPISLSGSSLRRTMPSWVPAPCLSFTRWRYHVGGIPLVLADVLDQVAIGYQRPFRLVCPNEGCVSGRFTSQTPSLLARVIAIHPRGPCIAGPP